MDIDIWVSSKRKSRSPGCWGWTPAAQIYQWGIKLLESSLMKCWGLFQLLTKFFLKNPVHFKSLFLFRWSSLCFAKAAYEVSVVEFHKARGFSSCQHCQASVLVQSLCKSAGTPNWPEEIEGTVYLTIFLSLFYSNRNFGSFFNIFRNFLFLWNWVSGMKTINSTTMWWTGIF